VPASITLKTDQETLAVRVGYIGCNQSLFYFNWIYFYKHPLLKVQILPCPPIFVATKLRGKSKIPSAK